MQPNHEPSELEHAKVRAKRALIRLSHQVPDARTELDEAQADINDAQGVFNDTVVTESFLPPLPVEGEVRDIHASVDHLCELLVLSMRRGAQAAWIVGGLLAVLIVLVLVLR